ncbi:hypothetical protein F5H01DRAFT_336679 [Linnemannia elongata]|nr:hypothetical protein F5H01DRAFT_336679 [Linnemannia elongata]
MEGVVTRLKENERGKGYTSTSWLNGLCPRVSVHGELRIIVCHEIYTLGTRIVNSDKGVIFGALSFFLFVEAFRPGISSFLFLSESKVLCLFPLCTGPCVYCVCLLLCRGWICDLQTKEESIVV